VPATLRPLDDVLPPADAVLARDWLLPTADELLERIPLLVLVTFLDPAARVLVVEERPDTLAVEVLRALGLPERRSSTERALEAERPRALRERALDAGRALERAAARDRAFLDEVVDFFMAERDFAEDDVLLLLTARFGLHTHTYMSQSLCISTLTDL